METDLHKISLDKLCSRLGTSLTYGISTMVAEMHTQAILPLPMLSTRVQVAIAESGINPLIVLMYLMAMYDNAALAGMFFIPFVLQTIYNVYKHDKAFQKQNQKLGRGHVIRQKGKKEIELENEPLVPGDLVILKAGDIVSADIRVFYSNRLIINKSMLVLQTDFNPVNVDDKNPNFLESSRIAPCTSHVISGSGLGIVLFTGLDTYMQNISYSKTEVPVNPTHFKLITQNGIFSGVCMILALVFRIFYNTHVLIVVAILLNHGANAICQLTERMYSGIQTKAEILKPQSLWFLGKYIDTVIADIDTVLGLKYRIGKILHGDKAFLVDLASGLRQEKLAKYGSIYESAIVDFYSGEETAELVEITRYAYGNSICQITLKDKAGVQAKFLFGELIDMPEAQPTGLEGASPILAIVAEENPSQLLAAFQIESVSEIGEENILKDAADFGYQIMVISRLPSNTSQKLLADVLFSPKYVLSGPPPENFGEELEPTLILRDSFSQISTYVEKISEHNNAAIISDDPMYGTLGKGITLVKRPNDLNTRNAEVVLNDSKFRDLMLDSTIFFSELSNQVETVRLYYFVYVAVAILGYKWGISTDIVIVMSLGTWACLGSSLVLNCWQTLFVIIFTVVTTGIGGEMQSFGPWVAACVIFAMWAIKLVSDGFNLFGGGIITAKILYIIYYKHPELVDVNFLTPCFVTAGVITLIYKLTFRK